MNYKNRTENKIENGEILSAEDEKIRLLLGSLKRVGAPNNFDFRLKARFANAKTNNYQPQFFPVLRFVLPLSLVLLICAVVFNGVYFSDKQNVPQIAEINPQTPVRDENQLNKSFVNEPGNVANVSQTPANDQLAGSIPASNVIPVKDRTVRRMPEISSSLISTKSVKKSNPEILSRENMDKDLGGSRDSTSTSTRVITQPGISINPTIKASPNAMSVRSSTARDVLLQFGIEAVFENENWTVKSVMQNSPAERSNIKVGDSIEAIDGEKLTDKPMQNKIIKGKKLRITRGAKKIEISLNNPAN